MSSITCKCRACGATIKLESKNCVNCGAENAARLERIATLESKRKKTDKRQAKILGHASKRKNMRGDRVAEFWDKTLTRRERRLRMEQAKLEMGGTHEGKLRWIKEQIKDLKRPIQEVADDLGVSMIAIGKYIDEIEKQEN